MIDSISRERWQKAKEIFSHALELDAARRREYVKHVCGNDHSLLKEVVSLLEAYDTPGAVDRSLDELKISALSEPESADITGKHIGPYRIIDELGYGGMGTVYLADRDDGEFEQRVALKLLRTGFTSDEQTRRFRTERQILATLNHENIARLYDGGITDGGQPYFVMEYIEGQSLDKYCDAQKLTITHRLDLFLKVCDAIQYAHRKLIVHRDLKPGNILVAGDGKVKLLDFGIAKVLNASDVPGEALPLTQDRFLPLTPSYASPEQIRGDQITTSSDIYQLGIVLYELLSGIKPYDINGKTPGEMERIICEDEPVRPSSVFSRHNILSDFKYDHHQQSISRSRRSAAAQLRRRLRGDLDTIVMKALRKEPDRRYESVEQLASDIRRYLSGKPVSAHPDSLSYRVGKFIRRNRVGVAAFTIIMLLLIGYAVTITWHSQRTQAALEEAEREKAKSDQVVEFMMEMFQAGDPAEAMGSEVTARELLRRGIEQAEALSGQPEVQAEMFSVIGLVYRRLGEFQEAKPLLSAALELKDSVYDDTPLELARGYYNLAAVMHDLGEYGEAHRNYEAAADLFRKVPGYVSLEYAAALHNLAVTRHGEVAGDDLKQAVAMRQELLGYDHPDIAESYLAIGEAYLRSNDFEIAENYFRKVLSIVRRDHEGAYTPQVAGMFQNLGNGYRALGHPDLTEELLYEALEIYNSIYDGVHINIAMCKKSLADMYRDRGDFQSAGNYYDEALSDLTAAVGPGHPLRRPILQGRARLYVDAGDHTGAEPLLREVLALLESVLREDHPRIAHARRDLGASLVSLGQYREAEKLLQASLRSYRELNNERYDTAKAFALEKLIRLYGKLGKEDKMNRYAEQLAGFTMDG